ncbi:MAG: exodeoxyribonuclease VII large subunit [Saprospiraceae bacterium]|nr:exodeoxyribonuclease VII large subunit [Saprospiraceae bacterium]
MPGSATSCSLFDLNEHVRRVLALNLPDALWVRAEIAQVNESRGHYYLSLVEKGGEKEEILAQAEAVIWQQTARQLHSQLGSIWRDLLRAGMEVLLKVRVEFHERYGFKLLIQDIDPAYTLGKLELERRNTIQRLKEVGFFDLNRSLQLPLVLQRVAVISSPKAAGFQDFWKHLQGNRYGYGFSMVLFPVAVQGEQAEQEVLNQLKKIQAKHQQFDCLVVIRGGGARLDLTAFDSYAVCAQMARLSIPVLCGIGHDTDETVLDLVAHTALKTPTAVADFLIGHNLHFETTLVQLQLSIRDSLWKSLETANLSLEYLAQQCDLAIRQKIRSEYQVLNHQETLIPVLFRQRLRESALKLQGQESLLEMLSVENTLKRGFTLTTKDGKIVRAGAALKPGDRITTHFGDGEAVSEVRDD